MVGWAGRATDDELVDVADPLVAVVSMDVLADTRLAFVVSDAARWRTNPEMLVLLEV